MVVSGGAYHYMGHGQFLFGSAMTDVETLEEIAGRLDELGCPDAAKETRDVLATLDRLNDQYKPLCELWIGLEWLDSGDRGEDEFRADYSEYRRLKGDEQRG